MSAFLLVDITVDDHGYFHKYGPPAALTIAGMGLYVWISLGLVAGSGGWVAQVGKRLQTAPI